LYGSGPFIHGGINKPDQNQTEFIFTWTYQLKDENSDHDIETMCEDFLKEFEKGEYGFGAYTLMNLMVEKQGFSLVVGFQQAFDFDQFKQEAIATPQWATVESLFTETFTQIAGSADVIQRIAKSSDMQYEGMANDCLYGCEGFYGVTGGDGSPLNMKLLWGLVPLLDFTSAGYTAYRWCELNYCYIDIENPANGWFAVAGTQATIGTLGLTFWTLSYVFGDPVLVAYVLFHVIAELLLLPGIAAADYFAPATDFEVEATYWSYFVASFNVLISVIVNGAYVLGADISDL
jgi:hypothetical protein